MISDIDKQITIRKTVSIAVLTAIAILLVFLRVRLPFISGMFGIDFSVFPELLAAIAFGPIAGIVVCLIKAVIHIAFIPTALIPDIASVAVDIVFIVFAEILYSSHMYMSEDEDMVIKPFEREKAIFFSSIISVIPALILQFFLTEFFVYPKLEKYYSNEGLTYDNILANYAVSTEFLRNHFPSLAKSIPDFKGIWQGVLFVNLPLAFIKYLIVAIVTMVVYKYISPFFHYRQD